MADRTSAEIFSNIIELLADNALTLEKVYKMSYRYDFSDRQLSDKAYNILVKKGILAEEDDNDN